MYTLIAMLADIAMLVHCATCANTLKVRTADNGIMWINVYNATDVFPEGDMLGVEYIGETILEWMDLRTAA